MPASSYISSPGNIRPIGKLLPHAMLSIARMKAFNISYFIQLLEAFLPVD